MSAAAQSAEYAESPDQPGRRQVSQIREIAESAEPTAQIIRAALSRQEPQALTSAAHLPAFPVDALPKWSADMVEAVSESVQVPTDSPGSVCLGTFATACGGRAVVEPRGDWSEPVNLFVLITAGSSERKSPVLRQFRAPLVVAERQLTSEWSPRATEAEVLAAAARQRADAERKSAAAIEDEGEREAALKAAAKLRIDADQITVPVRPRILGGGDATPEAVASLLIRHAGRFALWDAEGGLFDLLAGRYSKGGPNLDSVLKSYSGEAIHIERTGRDPEYVENPALTLLLMVQPVTLRRVVGDADMVERGLAARFLFTLPASLVGRRRTGRSVTPIPAHVRETFTGHTARLAIGMHEWEDPARLALSSEALDVLDEHEARTERRLGPGGDLAGTGAWGGKHDGRTLRLAGLLHLASLGPDRGPRAVISGEHLHQATRLADYFAEHAKVVLGPADPALGQARELVEWLRLHEVTEFTIRDLVTRLPRGKYPNSETVQAVVTALADRGWVREVPAPPRSGAGRKPSPTYVTHPRIAAESIVRT